MVEKRQNCLDVDVIEVKIGDRAADPIGDEQEEEAERMAVCADGVRARSSNALKVIDEVRFDEVKKPIAFWPRHANPRRVANRRWRRLAAT